jgi:hypothetical protein
VSKTAVQCRKENVQQSDLSTCTAIYAADLAEAFCAGGDSADASVMNRKSANLAYWSLNYRALGPRLLGSSCVGGRAQSATQSANRLLTGDPETVDIIKYMETVCD